jgi:hypothetical protein
VAAPAAVYRPRNPQSSDYYRCVEDYFETFVQIYGDQFSRQYGFWQPNVEQVIYRYLDCGYLYNVIARGKCKDCGHKYLLAFHCKCRCFQLVSAPRGCTGDEGRSLEAGLQERASNHLKLHW